MLMLYQTLISYAHIVLCIVRCCQPVHDVFAESRERRIVTSAGVEIFGRLPEGREVALLESGQLQGSGACARKLAAAADGGFGIRSFLFWPQHTLGNPERWKR